MGKNGRLNGNRLGGEFISYKGHTGSLCREKHYFIRSEIADWRYNYFLAYKKIADEGELFDLRDAFESAACLSAHSIVENLAYGTTPEMYADMSTM